jgi:Uma2 family endonuclease
MRSRVWLLILYFTKLKNVVRRNKKPQRKGFKIMSTPALLEKTNILQRDSPPKIWTRYELPNDLPKTVQFEQKTPEPQKTTFIEPKTPFTKAQNELPSCDGIPMETERHKLQMDLLINSLKPWLGERGYVGGNMFVYFSPNQVKNEDFRGPDVFVALGCSNQERKSWVVWEEGQSPALVIELLSESTTKEDKGKKKRIYQDKLGVQEYYWFDPHNPDDFRGFELTQSVKSVKGVYQELSFQKDGFISQQLGLKLIRWRGVYDRVNTLWLRWALPTGELLLLPEEIEAQRAKAAELKAQAEAQRANAAEQRAQVALKEGEQKGRLTEKQEIARNLLAEGLSPTIIAKTTGLSLDELATLK